VAAAAIATELGGTVPLEAAAATAAAGPRPDGVR
jgi:hypothetical protein